MKLNFETSVEQIREVNQDRKYWFVRTYSGELFTDFVEKKYIGIGFNEVPMNYLSNADLENDFSKKPLKEFIENNTDYEKGEATKWANQLISFNKSVKIGDIVVIPSKNSSDLAIGVIESGIYLTEEPGNFWFGEKYESYPEKRRKVSWQLIKPRGFFRNDLNSVFNTRQAISNIDDLGNTIEGYLSNVFKKGERTYLTLLVNRDEDINAYYFRDFLDSLTFFYSEICKELDKEVNDERLFIKIKVQSKGKVALWAISSIGVLSLGIITMMAKNPQIKIELGQHIKLDAQSDGLLPAISDFLDKKQERTIQLEKFRRSMEELEIKDSTDVLEEEIPNQSQK